MVEYRMHRVSWLSSTEGKAHVDFEHSREDVTALSIAFWFQVVGREAPLVEVPAVYEVIIGDGAGSEGGEA